MPPLQSRLFTAEEPVRKRLQACADDNARNIHQGNDPTGDFVGNIQIALTAVLGRGHGITDAELEASTYGDTTAGAVFRFKSEPALNGTGGKILGPGQLKPDRIVGKQTIVALDLAFKRKETPGGAPPIVPTALKTQDVFVQILGADPSGIRAGEPTLDGFLKVNAPRPAQIAERVNDAQYLAGHRPVVMVNFRGGGGRANPASDPADKVVALVAAARRAAGLSGAAAGKVCVVGFSIGGRGAVSAARKLVAAGIPVTYLGLVDAAFDGAGDVVRTQPVGAGVLENIFESVHHFVLAKFPGFEFHGDVGGQAGVPLDGQPFYRQARAADEARFNAASSDRDKRAVADAHFIRVHDQAVKDNYPIIIRRAISQLTGPRP